MRCLKFFLFLLITFSAQVIFAERISILEILTGSESGAYYNYGKLFSDGFNKRYPKEGFILSASVTQGSLQNWKYLIKSKTAGLAIMQSDFFRLPYSKFEKYGEVDSFYEQRRKVKFITNLFSETVYFLVGSDIKNVNDLKGQKIYLGLPSSGTKILANNIINDIVTDQAKVDPDFNILLVGDFTKYDQALEALKKGEIKGMFYISANPSAFFSNIQKDSGITLMSLDKDLHDRYKIFNDVSIPQKKYDWLDKDINSISVYAALVSYDFTIDSESVRTQNYFDARCDQLGLVTGFLYDEKNRKLIEDQSLRGEFNSELTQDKYQDNLTGLDELDEKCNAFLRKNKK